MRRKQLGFSLVELLVVLAVMAILSALMIPAIRAAFQSARRAKAISSMRQIAMAYMHYAYDSENGIRDIILGEGATAHDWIKVLAKRGYFNDPRLVMFDFDYLVKSSLNQANIMSMMGWILGAMPRRIYDVSRQDLDEDFAKKPLSIVVADSEISAQKAVPIAWTRGLNEEGYWNESQGPQGGVFGTSGGIIAFNDGSAKWFDDLHRGDCPLYKWGTKESVFNIFECFGPDVLVLDWQRVLHSGISVSSASGQEGNGSGEVQENTDENEEIVPSPEDDNAVPPGYSEDSSSVETGKPSGTSPDYESLALEIDFQNNDLVNAAAASGVGEVSGGILDAYEQLSLGSGADNGSVDGGISRALEALAEALNNVGISIDKDEEAQALYWSGFLGDEGVYYTDNQDVMGRDPIEDAETVLSTLQDVDVRLAEAYDNLDTTQKSQFAAVVETFSSGNSSQSIDDLSDGTKLARAYLANQFWIAAMQRTISGGAG
jgi:prepilin-type N-terminal cleavage/methylation domain-containing protein